VINYRKIKNNQEMLKMSYKITRKDEAYKYEAAKHFDVRTTRLCDPQDVNDGVMTIGLSHFLPGGGCEYGSNALESVYYIVEGEMTLTVANDEGLQQVTVLHKGDAFHCGAGTPKSVINTGSESCQMLVALYKKPAA
jgi:quercetin dioxygenase-like cupin family protein